MARFTLSLHDNQENKDIVVTPCEGFFGVASLNENEWQTMASFAMTLPHILALIAECRKQCDAIAMQLIRGECPGKDLEE